MWHTAEQQRAGHEDSGEQRGVLGEGQVPEEEASRVGQRQVEQGAGLAHLGGRGDNQLTVCGDVEEASVPRRPRRWRGGA